VKTESKKAIGKLDMIGVQTKLNGRQWNYTEISAVSPNFRYPKR
jgi:hypothetical protein